MKKLFAISIVCAALCGFRAFANDRNAGVVGQEATMKVRIIVEGAVYTATMDDNPTARDFMSLLPLTLTLDEYAGTEKISYLPRKLSTDGAPEGSKPSAGSLAYYAPWGNLSLFYRDFRYSPGLVLMGKLDSGNSVFDVKGPIAVTFEIAR